ncbi:MAG: serine/threonine protein kinase [Planctomycetes bacterium]|nr:serine/threonine protein kinase [Planctomycetota bacterium]
MTSARADEPPDDLVRDLLARVLDGLEDEGSAAVERVCREHPQAASAVRRRLATLRAAGLLDDAAEVGGFPERLGDYRLLERLGGGGMGVVYLARQEGLGRIVALKLVRPEHLYFPDARARFAREVEAVAKLAHPGIVPVYAAGEEQGVPYLAMEYVRGATLGELLADLRGRDPRTLHGGDLTRVLGARVATSSGAGFDADESRDVRASRGSDGAAARQAFAGAWTDTCLRLVEQAARALQHAHERGVLHRDLKPSNLILSPDGRLLLLDFGLAVSKDSTRITRTGSELGSAPYASPEQVRGRFAEVDERSDVYSLGVTLYELLTLHLPYLADDVEATRALILEGRAPPPRALNPSVPRDAETVCLLAMFPERARRYASAADFADDLRRVLERRPPAGRRPGPLAQARRWVARHPAATTAIGLFLVLVLGGPLAWGFEQRRAAARLAQERDRAERNFDAAREAVRTMLSEVGGSDLADVPAMEPVRRRLLERALAFQEAFLAERSDDPRLQHEYAEALSSVAHLRLGLGDADGAVDAFAEAARIRRGLLEASEGAGDDGASRVVRGTAIDGATEGSRRAMPDAVTLRAELAEDLLGVFSASSFAGRPRAQDALDEALALRRALVRDAPDDAALALDLQRTLSTAAVDVLQHGDARGSETLAREAVALHDGFGASDEADLARAVDWNNLGQALAALGRADEAVDALLRAVSTVRASLDEGASSSEAELSLALALLNAGTLLRALDRADESAACSERALELLGPLAERFPERVQPRSLLATAYSNHAIVLDELGRPEEALRQAAAAAELLDDLSRDAPGVPDFAAKRGATLVNRASLLRELGRPAEARDDLLAALDAVRTARAADPAQSEWTLYERNTRWFLVLTALELGEVELAAEQAEALADVDPRDPDDARLAAVLLLRCAGATDDVAQAAAWRATAFALVRTAVQRGLADPDVLRGAPFDGLRDDPSTAEGLRALVDELERARDAASDAAH